MTHLPATDEAIRLLDDIGDVFMGDILRKAEGIQRQDELPRVTAREIERALIRMGGGPLLDEVRRRKSG